MAATGGDIAFRFGANIAPLVAGMSDASSAVNRFAGRSSEQFKIVARDAVKLGAAAVAVVGSLGLLTKSAAEAGSELIIQARLANATTDEFQKMAAGARGLGVENDQLSDILKDMNDRVGDFMTTGAGPMVDFFEKVAPKVGVTIDQFKELSGPQALGLYMSSLEKANLTQSEMTFHMEAMASDLTKLQPLFNNNAKLLNSSAKEAKELGLILSEIDLHQLQMGSKSFAKLNAAAKITKDLIGVALVPVFDGLIKQLMASAKEAGGFRNIIESLVNTTMRGFGQVGNAIRILHLGFKGLQVVAYGFATAVVSATEIALNAIVNFADIQKKVINTVIDGLNKIPNVDIAKIDLFTDSAFMNGVRNMGDTVRMETDKVISEFVKLGLTEMPGDKVEKFLADLVLNHKSAAEEMIKNRDLAEAAATSAKEGSGDGGRAAKNAAILKEMEENFQTEKELKAQQENEILILEQAFLDKRNTNKNKYLEMISQAQKRHVEELSAHEKKHLSKSDQFSRLSWQNKTKEMSGALVQMTAGIAQHSKKAFKINKAAGIANALINAYQGISKTMAAYPYPYNIGMAAAHAASAFAQVQAIRSQSFSGGGGGGRAPSSAATEPSGVTNIGGGSSQQSEPQRIIVEGLDPDTLLSGRAVMALIQEAADNGSILTVG